MLAIMFGSNPISATVRLHCTSAGGRERWGAGCIVGQHDEGGRTWLHILTAQQLIDGGIGSSVTVWHQLATLDQVAAAVGGCPAGRAEPYGDGLCMIDVLVDQPEGHDFSACVPRLGVPAGQSIYLLPWRQEDGVPGHFIDDDPRAALQVLPHERALDEPRPDYGTELSTLDLTERLQGELVAEPSFLLGAPVFMIERVALGGSDATHIVALHGVISDYVVPPGRATARLRVINLAAVLTKPGLHRQELRARLARLRASLDTWHDDYYHQRRIYHIIQHDRARQRDVRYMDQVAREHRRRLLKAGVDADLHDEQAVKARFRSQWQAEKCLFLIRRGFQITALDEDDKPHEAASRRVLPEPNWADHLDSAQITEIGRLRLLRALHGSGRSLDAQSLWGSYERSVIIQGGAGCGKTLHHKAAAAYLSQKLRPDERAPRRHALLLSRAELGVLLGHVLGTAYEAASTLIRERIAGYWHDQLVAQGEEPHAHRVGQLMIQAANHHYCLLYDHDGRRQSDSGGPLISAASLHELGVALPELEIGRELASQQGGLRLFACVGPDSQTPPESERVIHVRIELSTGWQQEIIAARFQPLLANDIPADGPLQILFDGHRGAAGLAEWRRFHDSARYTDLVLGVTTPAQLFAIWHLVCRLHCLEGRALRPLTCAYIEGYLRDNEPLRRLIV